MVFEDPEKIVFEPSFEKKSQPLSKVVWEYLEKYVETKTQHPNAEISPNKI